MKIRACVNFLCYDFVIVRHIEESEKIRKYSSCALIGNKQVYDSCKLKGLKGLKGNENENEKLEIS